jgi:hypothetical protein
MTILLSNVAQGGISKASRKTHAQAAAKCLSSMKKIVDQRHLMDETRELLHNQLSTTATRVTKLLAGDPKVPDPLANYRPQVRTIYERIIGLIYECATNRVAAKSLVEKILAKLEPAEDRGSTTRRARKRGRR